MNLKIEENESAIHS